MKPPPFAYHAPERLADALELLADRERDVRVLAGGQSLVPMMNFRLARPDVLVDLNRIPELRSLRVRAGGELEIGAAARQAELLRDERVRAGWPLLVEGVRHVGHPQVRSRGTVCGSLAHHDPTAELPALAVAHGARIALAAAGGRREVAAEDFFRSYYEVALDPGEMIEAVLFPPLPPAAGWAFREISPRRGDFALAGAVCVLVPEAPRRIGAARIVLFGVGERPLRHAAAEQALVGSPADPEVAKRAAELVAEAIEPLGDVHATAEYRRSAAAELTARCVIEAWERCG